MPLTPADIANTTFKKPSLGKRGYDEEEVDAFLDMVEAELARLIEVAAAASGGSQPYQEQVDYLSAALAEAQQHNAALTAALEAASQSQVYAAAPAESDGARASRVLTMANEMAERCVAEAQEQAAEILTAAQAQGEQASAEAERLLVEAGVRAEEIMREQQTQYAQTFAALDEQRTGLENEIERLRTFEQEYRLRFRSYLESHLRDLDTRTVDTSESTD